jgi:hypothetical protein
LSFLCSLKVSLLECKQVVQSCRQVKRKIGLPMMKQRKRIEFHDRNCEIACSLSSICVIYNFDFEILFSLPFVHF